MLYTTTALPFFIIVSVATLTLGYHEQRNWTYGGLTGPSNWGHLKSEFTKCNRGKYQSPVDLSLNVMRRTTGFPEIKMPSFSKLDVKTNEHTIQWTPRNDGQSRVWKVNGQEYLLAQFHVHTPSEHWIDEKYYDGEVHFVHQTSDGKIAVLGIFFEATDEDNPRWASVLGQVPQYGHSNVVDLLLETDEINRLSTNGYFHYKGSLTTPPCAEGVEWFVMVKPIKLSMKQIRIMSNLLGFSARPVQLNDDVARQITMKSVKYLERQGTQYRRLGFN